MSASRSRKSGEPVAVHTADGQTLSAHFHAVAVDQTCRGAVLLLPAIATPSWTLASLAASLAEQGWAVLRSDYRFSGDSHPRPSRRRDASMADLLFQDVPALLDALEQRAPSVPILCGGHSLGGQLSALALSSHSTRVRGAVLINCGLPRESLWRWPDRLVVATAFRWYPALAAALGYLPSKPMGLGSRMPATLVREWGRWGRQEHYRTARADLAQILTNAAGPVLSVGVADDALYVPDSAHQAFLSLMPRAVTTTWTLSPREMGVDRLGHFGLLRSPTASTLAMRLAAWMEQWVPDAPSVHARAG